MRTFCLYSIVFVLAGPAPVLYAQAPQAGNNAQQLSYRIIGSEAHTWGYDIYTGDRKLIHQPSIPGAAGNKGFHTKKMAAKVAGLVISKIARNEMPPTVTPDELKKLNCR